MVKVLVRGMQCVQSVGNGFIRSANRVHYTECMNAFPTRGGERFGYDEAPVRGTQCIQSVGAGLPDRPAVGVSVMTRAG